MTPTFRSLIELAGLLAIALSIFLAWRARRRARQNDPAGPACPTCGYSLHGLIDEQPCPECGQITSLPQIILAKSNSRRRDRTRFALLAALGLWLLIFPRLLTGGPLGLIPSTALLWISPPAASVNQPDRTVRGTLFRELGRRHNGGNLWLWQSRFLLWRHPDIAIAVRPTWPADQPLCVRVGEGFFKARDHTRRIILTPRPPLTGNPAPMNFAPTRLSGGQAESWPLPSRHDTPLTFDPPPAGLTSADFDLLLEEYDPATRVWKTVLKSKISKPIRVVDNWRQVLPVWTGQDSTMHRLAPEFQAAMTDRLQRHFRFWLESDGAGGGRAVATVHRASGDQAWDPFGRGDMDQAAAFESHFVAAGMNVQFLFQGRVVAEARLRPPLDTYSAGTGPFTAYTTPDDPGDLWSAWTAGALGGPDWRIRVTASPGSAIRDFHARAAWSGQFEGRIDEFILGRDVTPVAPTP